jgi:uncharacterized protein YndB with AHSA1/START domain
MTMTDLMPITVSVLVRATPERAWQAFTSPAAVTQWNFASPDWHCPRAENDLRPGGAFTYRMEARDGSFGFDLEGRFLEVAAPTRLRYTLGDDRPVDVQFVAEGDGTRVTQTFAPEGTHSLEQQREGWQAILENYGRYVESSPGA